MILTCCTCCKINFSHFPCLCSYYTSQKYKDQEGDVTRKDGIILLRELATEVKNFMDFKMNAVMVSFLSGVHGQTSAHLFYV